MQLGRSRSQALEAMASRTRQEDLQRFVWAMMQVDKLGVPVAAVLREQAKEMRAKRYARAREQAQKVPVEDPHAADAVLPARALRHHPRAGHVTASTRCSQRPSEFPRVSGS